VFPGGVGQTDLQVQAIGVLRPTGYVGTPSFLRALVERGIQVGVSTASISKALVTGEALTQGTRTMLTEAGIATYQCYASADIGLLAYETVSRDGLVVDEELILEILRPGTGEPVADGTVGEVVVTILRPEYPLIRFATGDLSAVLPGQCPTGRTNTRIRGWLGRTDQATKVRGMFVTPSQMDELRQRFPEVGRMRLIVSRVREEDDMELRIEVAREQVGLERRLQEALRDVTRLRGQVSIAAPGALPDDGKVIEDRRALNT